MGATLNVCGERGAGLLLPWLLGASACPGSSMAMLGAAASSSGPLGYYFEHPLWTRGSCTGECVVVVVVAVVSCARSSALCL